jgi:hypothetical protein
MSIGLRLRITSRGQTLAMVKPLPALRRKNRVVHPEGFRRESVTAKRLTAKSA